MNSLNRAFHFIGVTLLIGFCLSIASISTNYASDDSDDARNTVEKILEQKKFSESEGDAPLSGDVKRLSDWLGESKNSEKQERLPEEKRVEQQQSKSQPSNLSLPDMSGLSYVILIVLIVITVAGIGYIVVKAVITRDKTKKEEDDSEEDKEEIAWDDEEKVLQKIDDADVLESLADKAYSEGRFDIALRYRFRSGLLRLDKVNLIHFHPSTTNNSYQLMLNNVLFNTLVKSFNDVTYGKAECDIATCDAAQKSWQLLLNNTKTILQSKLEDMDIE